MTGTLKEVFTQAVEDISAAELSGFTVSEVSCLWDEAVEESRVWQQQQQSNNQPVSHL